MLLALPAQPVTYPPARPTARKWCFHDCLPRPSAYLTAHQLHFPSFFPAGKWPDNLEAFHNMKAAFGCQLAQQLHQTLGTEASASEDCVDVLTDGFAFRLLLATERDAAMQKKALQISERAADSKLASYRLGSCSRHLHAHRARARGCYILAPLPVLG
jgi:hypothetical protein